MSIVLSIPSAHAHLLAILRYWPDLNLARGDAEVWVRGFTEEQAVQSEVRSIPYISLFREQEGRLIPWGKSLPTKRLPGLLWTPIARAIPVESPDYNHNFFGVAEQITIGLVSHSSPQEAAALKTSFTALKAYVASAPAVRLQELRWVHSSEEQVLIMGHPLPALPGQTYWPLGEHWLPAGYTFELPDLAPHLSRKLAATEPSWFFWTVEGSYTAIPKSLWQPLSRSSVRLHRHQTPPAS